MPSLPMMFTRLSLVTAVAATQLGATDCGTVLRDPGFDLWCGDELCTWKTVRGEVRRVPTWHEQDAGVELVGDDAAIAQLAPVDSGDGSCIRFDLVANVEEGVEARLGVDVFGDGSIDLSERMPTSRWKPLSYKLRIAGRFSGIRFELSKRGTGRAVFAQIAAEIDRECDGLPEIEPAPAPLGAPCAEHANCASAMCGPVPDPAALFGSSLRCVGCTPATCGTGEVCGRGAPVSPVLGVPVTCVPEGASELGEQCLVDTECASGVCTGYVCSACAADADCGAATCAAAFGHGPYLCAPGQTLAASGAPCATDADCISLHCNGAARMQCSDGRACDSPADCPVEDDLAPGACSTVGIQGGSCQ